MLRANVVISFHSDNKIKPSSGWAKSRLQEDERGGIYVTHRNVSITFAHEIKSNRCINVGFV